jgi:hypothetical protein
MSISTRRKYGIVFVAISAVALVVFLTVDFLYGDWHFEGGGSSGSSLWACYSVHSGVSEYYFIPILLCGAVGAFCLLWPARKPPKLNQ